MSVPHLLTLPCCRVRDTAIVVAVDEPPEEGLDQPLRLEKLANEVCRLLLWLLKLLQLSLACCWLACSEATLQHKQLRLGYY